MKMLTLVISILSGRIFNPDSEQNRLYYRYKMVYHICYQFVITVRTNDNIYLIFVLQ